MTDDVIVCIQDCRELQYCSGGIRLFFRQYNLDYTDFLTNGIEAKKLLEASGNNELARKVVEVAYERWRRR